MPTLKVSRAPGLPGAVIIWFRLGFWSLTGCSPPSGRNEQQQGPGGQEQPLGLSPSQELKVGRRAYDEVMAEVGGRALPANAPESVRVRRVIDRLVEASEIEPLQREIMLRTRGYRFEWDVHVIRDQQVNA